VARFPPVYLTGVLLYAVTPPLRLELCLFPVSLALAIGVSAGLWYVVCSAAYFRDTATGELSALVFVNTVLGGVVVPLDFYPSFLHAIANAAVPPPNALPSVALLTGKLRASRSSSDSCTRRSGYAYCGDRARIESRSAPAGDAGRLSDARQRLALWARLASAAIRSQMQYRTSFAIQNLVMFGVMVSDLVPVWVLSRFFGAVDGWSFAELALLYGMVETSWATVETALRGFENFSVYLIQGDLDRILLRPRNVVLQVAARDFDARKLSRIAQAVVVLGVASFALGLGPRSLAWVALGVAGGMLSFAGIVMAGAAISSGRSARRRSCRTS
jgi:ABC-type uncharacterized transport system permease subunit